MEVRRRGWAAQAEVCGFGRGGQTNHLAGMRKAMAGSSFLREFVTFAKEQKVWWIVPLALVAAIVLIVMLQSSGGSQPFEYPVE